MRITPEQRSIEKALVAHIRQEFAFPLEYVKRIQWNALYVILKAGKLDELIAITKRKDSPSEPI